MNHTIKVICIQDLNYNLTKPYFKFKKGKVYESLNRKMISYIDRRESMVYEFTFCDMVLTEDRFFNYFETISEHRNKKLDSIGI